VAWLLLGSATDNHPEWEVTMNWADTSLVERETRAANAVLRARAAGADPYAPIFIGSGRRAGVVDPVEREYPAWVLFDDEVRHSLVSSAA
jgi:hypothetical protein